MLFGCKRIKFNVVLLVSTFLASSGYAAFEPALGDGAAVTISEGEGSAQFSYEENLLEDKDVVYTDANGTEQTLSYKIGKDVPEQFYHYEIKPGVVSDPVKELDETLDSYKATVVSQGDSNLGSYLVNKGKIGKLEAEIINNSNQNGYPNQRWIGIGLKNEKGGEISEIVGDFIGNSGEDKSWNWAYGAIANYGKIGNISGNFINNSIDNSIHMVAAGAGIRADGGEILSITNSKFLNNSVSSGAWSGGVAIYLDNGAKVGFIDNVDFMHNRGERGALELNTKSVIEKITNTRFYANQAQGGGALVMENETEIKHLEADFIKNEAQNGKGGAISIWNGAKIDEIVNSRFIENSATEEGSAISNLAEIGTIDAEFVKNSGNSVVYNEGSDAKITKLGGVFVDHNGIDSIVKNMNDADIQTIEATFINNTGSNLIRNEGTIGRIGGVIVANESPVIYNAADKKITTIDADFLNNTRGSGSGLVDNNGIIDTVGGTFKGNTNQYGAAPGMLTNSGEIASVEGRFERNESEAYAGAIYNTGTIGALKADFVGNKAKGSSDNVIGAGAVYTAAGDVGVISGSYVNNSVENGFGGAIFSETGLRVAATDKDIEFTGNTDSTGSNAIYMNNRSDDVMYDLELSAVSGKKLVMNDKINSNKAYNLFVGSETYQGGEVVLNNELSNVNEATITGTMLTIGENGSFGDGVAAPLPAVVLDDATLNMADGKANDFYIGQYAANGDSTFKIDLDTVEKKADVLHINGNVEGTTSVVVDATGNENVADAGKIVFVSSENDNTGSESSFSVYRVLHSPYEIGTSFEEDGTDKKWFLQMEAAPVSPSEPEATPLYAEALGYLSLPTAVIEQSRNVSRSVLKQAATQNGAFYAGKPKTWVSPVYHRANIDKKMDVDADIWGLDAGVSLGGDAQSQWGVFASYRDGNYDVGKEFKQYVSRYGSDVDIKSYQIGGYYMRDISGVKVMGDVFAGRQNVDLKTKDGVSAETDVNELGFGIRGEKAYSLKDNLALMPFGEMTYHYFDIDSMKDAYGKKALYDDLHFVELEAGVKAACNYSDDVSVYVTPSVIQTITSGDKAKVTGLKETGSLYEDMLLVKGEAGIEWRLRDNLVSSLFVSYTYADDYDATAVGAGLKYQF